MYDVRVYAHRYVPMRLHLPNLHIKDLDNLFRQAIVSPSLASSTMYVIDTYTLSGLLQQRAVFTHKTVVTPCPIGYECIYTRLQPVRDTCQLKGILKNG